MRAIVIFIFSLTLFSNVFSQVKVQSDGSLKVSTTYGYLEMGPKSSSYCYISTDRAKFLLNKQLFLKTGWLSSYSGINLSLDAGNGGYPDLLIKNSNGYVGINDYNPSFHLDVGGIIYCHTLTEGSDERLKEKIVDIDYNLAKNLFKIKAKSYKLKLYASNTQVVVADTNEFLPISTPESLKKQHYGFLAQDVQKVFPDLVYEDEEGLLSLNYTGFIPLMLELLKEQSKKIETLENELDKLKRVEKSSNNDSFHGNTAGYLSSNMPNPFSEETIIEYYIPVNSTESIVYVFNINGSIINQYPIPSSGYGEIVIVGSSLEPGLYYYSLIIDGITIDTHQMLLTK